MCWNRRAMRATCSASVAVFSSESRFKNCSASVNFSRRSSACPGMPASLASADEAFGDNPSSSVTSPTPSPPSVLTLPLMSLAAWLAMSKLSSSSMALSFEVPFGARRLAFNRKGRLPSCTALSSATSSSLSVCAVSNCNRIAARSRPRRALCSWDSLNDSSNWRCSSKSFFALSVLLDKRLISRRAALSSMCKWEISALDWFSAMRFRWRRISRSLSAVILAFAAFSSFAMARATLSSSFACMEA
mmetsp:Transcript_47272/g.132947  ORF Transcript_47272/g.132947 Transcript_47272/m.132947 type:complete len:246 (-) Transcript_47272:126-863(-)